MCQRTTPWYQAILLLLSAAIHYVQPFAVQGISLTLCRSNLLVNTRAIRSSRREILICARRINERFVDPNELARLCASRSLCLLAMTVFAHESMAKLPAQRRAGETAKIVLSEEKNHSEPQTTCATGSDRRVRTKMTNRWRGYGFVVRWIGIYAPGTASQERWPRRIERHADSQRQPPASTLGSTERRRERLVPVTVVVISR
jgi:hypothetical protein